MIIFIFILLILELVAIITLSILLKRSSKVKYNLELKEKTLKTLCSALLFDVTKVKEEAQKEETSLYTVKINRLEAENKELVEKIEKLNKFNRMDVLDLGE